MSLTLGTGLGPYEILSALGAGGMGEVYAALDPALGRKIAIKILPDDVAGDAERRERFEREAKAIAALNHPNIVTIHSIEEAGGVRFLTMELVEGQTLSSVIPKGGMALDRFLAIAILLADAVSAAHARGITHRDLKPPNVMIGADGRVKVLDFGLAKLRGTPAVETAATITAPAHVSTGDGRILGTVAYMSPEQAEGKPLDHRTDLFSLGVVFYEMLTGERPFTGDTNVSVLAAIVKDTPRSITEVKPDLPRDISKIVRKALAKDPGRRYQTAVDLNNDLEMLKEDISSGALQTPAHAASLGYSQRTWRVASLMLAAVAAVAALGWTLVLRRPAPDPQPDVAPVRFMLSPTAGAALSRPFPALALAPDERSFVAAVVGGGNGGKISNVRLEWRRFDSPEFVVLPGTMGATRPFFLSDGQRVGFLDALTNDLKVISLSGGNVQIVCPLGSLDLRGAVSGPDDSIVFSLALPGQRPSLRRVSLFRRCAHRDCGARCGTG